MSVYIDTWKGKDCFLERYDQGRMMFAHILNVLQERVRAEEEYQKKLEKIDKSNKSRLVTEHWTLGEGWNATEKYCSAEVQLREEFYTNLNDLLASGNEMRKDIQNTKQQLMNEISKWERGKEKTQSEMIKSHQKMKSITQELDQAKALANKQSESGDSKKNLLNKIHKLDREQEVATKQFKASERNYNNFLIKYKQGINKILNNFGELDAKRIISTRDLLDRFLQHNKKLYTSIEELLKKLKTSIFAIDERVDVISWIKEGLTQNLIDQKLNTFVDELSPPEFSSPVREDSPTSLSKFNTTPNNPSAIKKKRKLTLPQQKFRDRGGAKTVDPFMKSLNLLLSDNGAQSSESQSEDEKELEKEKDKEPIDKKDKKKSKILSRLEAMSPRGERRSDRHRSKKDKVDLIDTSLPPTQLIIQSPSQEETSGGLSSGIASSGGGNGGSGIPQSISSPQLPSLLGLPPIAGSHPSITPRTPKSPKSARGSSPKLQKSQTSVAIVQQQSKIKRDSAQSQIPENDAEDVEDVATGGSTAVEVLDPSEPVDTQDAPEHPPDDEEDDDEEPQLALALYPYSAKDSTELSLKRGDIITNVIESSASTDIQFPNQFWLYGTLHGKKGFFPFNFVELIMARGTKGTAEYDFVAEAEDELSIKVGEELTIISTSSDGWYRGRNDNNDIGLFPQNYVKILSTPKPSKE